MRRKKWIEVKMDIDVRVLKYIINRFFERLIDTHEIETISLDKTFYWQIDEEKIYDMTSDLNAESDIVVGDLRDDWELIKCYIDENNDPVIYQFTEIAPLLHYIGAIVGMKLGARGG
jgi:hypothetical protein